jgi:hypothetical protein
MNNQKTIITFNFLNNSNQEETKGNLKASSGGNITLANQINNQRAPVQDDDDKDPSSKYFDQFLSLIEELWKNGTRNVTCPGNQTRGWIFFNNNNFIEFTPCGCYSEALWPNLLGIPAAWKAGASVAAKKLIKRSKRKFKKQLIRYLSTYLGELDKSYFRAFKLLPTFNILKRKLPPVPPGHVRLWRGQGPRRLQARERNQSLDLLSDSPRPPVFNEPGGHWWISSENEAKRYTWSDGMLGKDSGKLECEIFYIDIPEEQAIKASLSRANGTIDGVGLLPGQRIGLDVSRYDENLGEYVFNDDVIMPLRRRNKDGIIEIVDGHPTRDDMDLNPGIFTTNEYASTIEYYLDSSINGTNFLSQTTAATNLAYESKLIALRDVKQKTRKVRKLMESLETAMDADDTSAIQKNVLDLESAFDEWKEETLKNFEAYDYEGQEAVFKELEDLLQGSIVYFNSFVTTLLEVLGFITLILELVTVVENKKCGPKNYQYSIITDTIRQIGIGLTPGYSSPSIPKLRDSEWDLIRQKLINDGSRVLWAELDNNCECDGCPEGWNLCNKTINYFTDYYNQCLKCQDCEFSSQFDPVYASNSKVPILLSHKSAQNYRSGPLVVEGNVLDLGCECECDSSLIPRYDKNNSSISTARILRPYTPNTGNIFEDNNCFGYRDGNKKIDIDIIKPNNSSYIESADRLRITPDQGRFIPGIPYETITEGKICDYSIAPDGLYESSIFPWLNSVYRWDAVLGRWTCKQTKECESPQVFTEGVAINNNYCDCTDPENSSSSSSSSSSDGSGSGSEGDYFSSSSSSSSESGSDSFNSCDCYCNYENGVQLQICGNSDCFQQYMGAYNVEWNPVGGFYPDFELNPNYAKISPTLVAYRSVTIDESSGQSAGVNIFATARYNCYERTFSIQYGIGVYTDGALSGNIEYIITYTFSQDINGCPQANGSKSVTEEWQPVTGSGSTEPYASTIAGLQNLGIDLSDVVNPFGSVVC